MVDRNLSIGLRGGLFVTREGMILEVPPSGFDWRAVHPGIPNIDPLSQNDTAKQWPLGTKLIYGERTFRYALAGASSLIAGNVLQGMAPVAGHVTEAVDTLSIGATTLTMTPSATAITTDEYQDGFVVQDAGSTGAGYAYKIKSNASSDGTTAFATILVDPLVVALPAAGTVSFIQSPWGEVLQAIVSTPTARLVGVAQSVITNAKFGWVQTRGPASVLTEGTVIAGNPMTGVTGTAGAGGPRGTALVVKEQIVGEIMVVGADDTWSTVFLTLE